MSPRIDPAGLRARIEDHVRVHELIPAGADVVCFVSGGADSSCLWHALRELGYRVSALHVDHGLRGAESDEDARHCRELLGAEIVDGRSADTSEAGLRAVRYRAGAGRLRATGHTASDQVETILYRLVSSGACTGIRARREDGVVRPLLPLWRWETEAYCKAEGLAFRRDSSNADSVRGVLRERVLPSLREIHPAAERNLLASLQESRPLPRRLERAVAELLERPGGSRRIDVGRGCVAVRECDEIWLESAPVRLEQAVSWGGWTIEPRRPGLVVRGWRAGDRLLGGGKLQDVFVDAGVPRSRRDGWPLVVRGDDVVVVPGLACARGFEDAVVATRAA